MPVSPLNSDTPFTDKQWGAVPAYMRGSLARYIQNGIEPGTFLAAVLSNDLRGACEAADTTNIPILSAYTRFLHLHAPAACWGSRENFDGWMEQHARARRQAEKEKRHQQYASQLEVGT